jgi:hypothetical protein
VRRDLDASSPAGLRPAGQPISHTMEALGSSYRQDPVAGPQSWLHSAIVSVPPSPGVMPSRHIDGSETVPHPDGLHGPASTGAEHSHMHCSMPSMQLSVTLQLTPVPPQPPTAHACPVQEVDVSTELSDGREESIAFELSAAGALSPGGGDASAPGVNGVVAWPPHEADPRRRGPVREAISTSCKRR